MWQGEHHAERELKVGFKTKHSQPPHPLSLARRAAAAGFLLPASALHPICRGPGSPSGEAPPASSQNLQISPAPPTFSPEDCNTATASLQAALSSQEVQQGPGDFHNTLNSTEITTPTIQRQLSEVWGAAYAPTQAQDAPSKHHPPKRGTADSAETIPPWSHMRMLSFTALSWTMNKPGHFCFFGDQHLYRACSFCLVWFGGVTQDF